MKCKDHDIVAIGACPNCGIGVCVECAQVKDGNCFCSENCKESWTDIMILNKLVIERKKARRDWMPNDEELSKLVLKGKEGSLVIWVIITLLSGNVTYSKYSEYGLWSTPFIVFAISLIKLIHNYYSITALRKYRKAKNF